ISGPGAGTEPRTPQKLTIIAGILARARRSLRPPEGELKPFRGRDNLELGRLLAMVGDQRVDLIVGALGRVMEQHHAFGAGGARDLDRVFGTGVRPMRLRQVLLGSELSVVDDEVGALA